MAATKHEEPYDALNPSFQLIARPAGALEGESAVTIMRMVETGLRNVFAKFETVEKIHEIQVGGRPAARFSASYVVTTEDGREFPTRSTLVVVPRGKVLYQIGFSGPPEGPDRLGSEIEEILGSVKFRG